MDVVIITHRRHAQACLHRLKSTNAHAIIDHTSTCTLLCMQLHQRRQCMNQKVMARETIGEIVSRLWVHGKDNPTYRD